MKIVGYTSLFWTRLVIKTMAIISLVP